MRIWVVTTDVTARPAGRRWLPQVTTRQVETDDGVAGPRLQRAAGAGLPHAAGQPDVRRARAGRAVRGDRGGAARVPGRPGGPGRGATGAGDAQRCRRPGP